MVPLTFLVASPHLNGGMFERSVILLLEHDHTGAMGLVINAPTELAIGELLPLAQGRQERAWVGGPVEPQVGWCIYEKPTGRAGEMRLGPNLYATSSLDVLDGVLCDDCRFMLLLGYAGWQPGQLDAELRNGTWLWVEDGAHLVFDTPAEDRWAEAMQLIGVKPDTIVPGGAQA
ncbi:YqgE/AlgH family protein [Deinococcus maricopensis]|uniref:UPF0301 protein Deima_0959 n=1 Tax=Deinococcus maricopensis (strain DSM 21211 / LMG 22137 / NRRL B-23946 / LB-34) TaxID=709986 RepID=E8U6C3_DEIML|nr:YqgE/AlgH family protein [Deinococcus maricopensis]ADV66612.1 UPF0301 protein yqgE [Deinococcus maricopensis DSM 21211]